MAGSTLRRSISPFLAVAMLASGCGWTQSSQSGGPERLTLYTCVSEQTVEAVIAGFEKGHPGSRVDLFRAPTGKLNARIAGDNRSGGLRADVIWACDPLTMHGYAEQDLLRSRAPDSAPAIPKKYRTEEFVGGKLLYMVIVVRNGVQRPESWADLTSPTYRGRVAMPDPGFAASAMGTLGYFDQAPGYGSSFYEALRANGAVEVNSPSDVLTGVARGTYDAGMTIASAAYRAKQDGSPVDVVWPAPGAIAIYAPIAVTRGGAESTIAEEFVTYVASKQGQATVAESFTYPVMPEIVGPPIPDGAPVVTPDWPEIYDDNERLLQQYDAVFAG